MSFDPEESVFAVTSSEPEPWWRYRVVPPAARRRLPRGCGMPARGGFCRRCGYSNGEKTHFFLSEEWRDIFGSARAVAQAAGGGER